jgi:hypothetical protein
MLHSYIKRGGAMKRLFFVLWLCVPSIATAGENVVTCKNPKGYAYYHYAGVLSKKDSGFVEDKITGGLTTLVRLNDKEYDLLFVDVRGEIISFVRDGGFVRLLRKGENDATFLAANPGMVIEIYTFYKDSGGIERYDLLQSKGGDGMPIHKSSVMTGTCSGLNLDLLR